MTVNVVVCGLVFSRFIDFFSFLHTLAFHKYFWGPFLESPGNLSDPKAKAKSRTLRLQSCFIHIFLI